MAVFKKKPKAKDDTYIIPTAAASDPALQAKLSRSLKRKQKNVVEPKPEIDLTTVLPDKNDFRTSLLMPGLSARFSMLREQDDPNTKVGKASDDSVLFPKRASRLNLFSHNPLTDIAETESIQTAFRAPFSDEERSYSPFEGAGYASDDAGSVLARSRPVDGNNLFGGRQKMYRIPTASGSGSSKDLTDAHVPLTSGRHLYQNDVVLSPYQQMRLKAREEQERDESRERRASAGAEEHDRNSVINTPSTGFSKSRGTTSSTASGPSNRRISTAATSVVSDAPHPRQSNTSSGSNSRMQGSEYGSEENLLKRNFSSDSRKGFPAADNQVQPPLPTSPSNNRQVFQSSSVSNLADKYVHGASPFSTNAFRTASPPPALQTQALASLDFGLKSSNNHPRRYQAASPTNDEDDGPIYKQSLQPNDRGKATALGLFNRPQQQFDEAKFQERQLQMHGGRISPPTSDGPDYGGIAERQNAPGRVVLPTIPTSPLKSFRGRESGSTSVTTRSRAQSTASSVNPAQVHAQVEALIRRQNEEYSTLQTQKSTFAEPNGPLAPLQPPSSLRDQPAASRGTFFDTFDGSDEEEDADSPMLGRYEPAPRLAPLDVHPALRNGSQAFDFGEHVSAIVKPGRPQSNDSVDTSSPSVTHDTPDTSDSLHRSSHTKAPDSPAFGPTTGLGLSGLIRTHLRHDSDRSSVMPPPSPGQPPYQSNFSFNTLRDREPSIVSIPTGNYRGSEREREPSVASTQPGNYPPSFRDREPSVASTARTINPPESTHSDPWEFDNAHRTVRSPLEPVQNEAIPAMSQKAQQILGQAISHRNQASSKTQQVLGDDAPGSVEQHPANRPWPPYDALSHHQRGESTETQKEFGNELAERARRIQEGLKGVAEAEKRSRSQDRHNPAAQALHALRHKTSKTSLAPRVNEPQPKAMKMLGIGVGQKPEPMGRSPNIGARGDYDFEQGYDEHDNRPTPRQRPAEFEPPSGRRTPGFSRPGPGPGPGPYHMNTNDDPERRYQRSATPNSGRARRDRAESEAAERSRSRTGRFRDEQPYAPGEYGRPGPPPLHLHREQQQRPYGPHDGPRGYPGPHPTRVPLRGPPPVDPRTYERSASAMSNRQPSASRPPPAGFYEGRAATPTMGGTPQLGPGPIPVGAPRPSPRPPFPHSPMSPFTSPPGMSPGLSAPASGALSALPSPSGPLPQQPPTGRFTPVEGRSTPIGSRKKSVTKGMISEPTFISSTSSVPLVGLPNNPRPSQIASPPIPSMNPRRRGNTMTERPDGYPSPRMPASPMPAMPDSPSRGGLPMSSAQRGYLDQQHQVQQKPPPRPRNRLRKISSEGGSMAARARNQAMMSEFGHERLRSPAMPVFPNRSATSLSIHQDGGMF